MPLADWPHQFTQIVAQVSSGCDQRCPFCCWDRPLSRKVPEIAAGDIRRLHELYPTTREKHVALLCNETTGCHDWLAAFCSSLGTDVQWSSPANVRNATLEDLQLAKAHGLLWVNLGIETLDNQLLVQLHKGHTVEDAFRVFRWLRDLEIGYRFSLRQRIGETIEALDNTIAALHRMADEGLHPVAVTLGAMGQWPGNDRWPGVEPYGSTKYPRWLLPLAADREPWTERWREIKRLTDELVQTT